MEGFADVWKVDLELVNQELHKFTNACRSRGSIENLLNHLKRLAEACKVCLRPVASEQKGLLRMNYAD